MKLIQRALFFLLSFFSSAEGFSYFLTGSGHYGARPEFRTNPDMKPNGNYFSLNQSFRLLGEFKANDRASFFAELRLFENPREAKLGDGMSDSNVFYPAYKFFQPRISKLYMKYMTDYAVFEVGRRPRSWAQGLLYDAGDKPFSSRGSVFDGVTASLNPSMSQSLGFMAGYDLLQDSTDTKKPTAYFHQIFGAVYYDTIKLGGSKPVATNTGLYFAHMFDSASEADRNVVFPSSLSFFDAYFNFDFRRINLEWKNEILGVWGKADPSRLLKFGAKESGESENFGSLSFATYLGFTFGESGSYHGPRQFAKGDYKRSVVFFDFVFLPGSSEGAKEPAKRDSGHVTAYNGNENFKKTLILFNAKPSLDSDSSMKVDGIFDPYRMMNVHFYSLGYRYEDLNIGNFEFRLSHARFQKNHDVADRVGNAKNGKSLGIEGDLSYSISFGQDVTVGADLGLFIPGKGLTSDKEAANIFLAQASVIFNL